MISNVRKNNMGTVSFDGKFGKMRNVAEFVVYPISRTGNSNLARIQSDNYCGFIDMRDDDRAGNIYLAKGSRAFTAAKGCGKLSDDDFAKFAESVRGSAGDKVGNNGIVYCDNSGAANV